MTYEAQPGVRVHVDWASECKLTDEEKAALVDKMIAETRVDHADWDKLKLVCEGTAYTPIRTKQLADIYESLIRLTRMGQATIEAWLEMPKEVADLRHAIFRECDMAAVFASQHLPRELRDEVRERANKPRVRDDD